MSLSSEQFIQAREEQSFNEREASLQANTDKILHLEGKDVAKPKMEAKKGNFSASNASRLLAGGAGKTRMTYILEVALKSIGIEDNIETSAMRHGTVNQYNAFDLVVKPLFSGAKWHDNYIAIDANSGASPDVLIDDFIPLDIKCPYSLFNYVEQSKQLPKKYVYQSVMQQMCTKAPLGYMLMYLTKPELWGEEGWKEYPIDLKDRYFLHEIKFDEQIAYEITLAVEKAVPIRDVLIEKLQAAKVIDEVEFFYEQLKSYPYKPIKEASNMLNVDFFRVNDEFYYKSK